MPKHSKYSSEVDDELIKAMVDRFLAWRLPEDFNPDAGISFKPTFNDHLETPMKYNPVGTNLLTATQAEQMLRHILESLATYINKEKAKAELNGVITGLKLVKSNMKDAEPPGHYRADLALNFIAHTVRQLEAQLTKDKEA